MRQIHYFGEGMRDIDNENNNINVTVNADKNEYNVKEKVKLLVSAKTKEGKRCKISASGKSKFCASHKKK